MKRWLLRKATKKWLKRYERKELIPNVRAVFVGDAVSTEVILNECYDTLTIDYYCNKLFPKLTHTETALDIGANIGNHSSIFANHFDQVFAFEPNPRSALLLRANSLGKQIYVIEKGLSDTHGKLNFELSYGNIVGSRIVNVDSDTTIEVETLDRLSKHYDYGNVSFLKIDVEGHEAKVLAGAKQLLNTQHPVIALELHPYIVPGIAGQVNNILMQAGYRFIYLLNPNRQVNRWVPYMLRPTADKLIPISTNTITDKHDVFIVSYKPLEF